MYNLLVLIILLLPWSLQAGNFICHFYSSILSIISLYVFRDRIFKLEFMKENKYIILFFAYTIVQCALISFDTNTLCNCIGLVRVPLCVFLMRNILDDKNKLFLFVMSCCLAVLFMSFNAIMQIVLGYDMFFNHIQDYGHFKRLVTSSGKMRLGLSISTLITVIIGYYCANMRSGICKESVVILSSVILGISIILLSGERIAVFLSFMSIGLFLILNNSMCTKNKMIFFSAILAMSSIIFMCSGAFYRVFTLTALQLNEISFDPYYRVYRTALLMIFDEHWFGIGVNMFYSKCISFIEQYSDALCLMHPHNFYLQLLLENGVFVLFFFFLAIKKGVSFVSNLKDKMDVSIAAFCTIVIKFIPFAPMDNIYYGYNLLILIFLFGIASLKKNH